MANIEFKVTNEVALGQLKHGCEDIWTWNRFDRSDKVELRGKRDIIAYFHNKSNRSSAGVRGTRILNKGRYYWEVHLPELLNDSHLMVGISTNKARLYANQDISLLGEDTNGWGLSHQGLLWHGNCCCIYTEPFQTSGSTVVGVLFDGIAGTVTFYKNGRCLGVAFRGLDKIKDHIYPMVCSTTGKTQMTLGTRRREYENLQDRCRALIVSKLVPTTRPEFKLYELHLPIPIKNYILKALQEVLLFQSFHYCCFSYIKKIPCCLDRS